MPGLKDGLVSSRFDGFRDPLRPIVVSAIVANENFRSMEAPCLPSRTLIGSDRICQLGTVASNRGRAGVTKIDFPVPTVAEFVKKMVASPRISLGAQGIR